MAAELDESYLDLGELDEICVMKLQAVCRGWLVRKELQRAQAEFLQVVAELDGPAVSVEWTGPLLQRPTVVKASRKKRTTQAKSGETSEVSSFHKLMSVSSLQPQNRGFPDRVCAGSESACNWNKPESDDKLEPVIKKTLADREIQTDFFWGSNPKVSVPEERLERRGSGGGGVDGGSTHSHTHTHTHSSPQCQTPRDKPADVDNHPASNSADIPIRDKPHDDDDNNNESAVSAQMMTVTSSGGYTSAGGCDNEESPHDGRNTNSAFPAKDKPDCSAFPVRVEPDSPVPEGGAATTPDRSPGLGVGADRGMRRVDSFHGDQTSVWDSSSSGAQDQQSESKKPGPLSRWATADRGQPEVGAGVTAEEALRGRSTEELSRQRQNVAMELMWVQQAIISRKQYLKLKTQMVAAS